MSDASRLCHLEADALTAWVASHSETDTAHLLGADTIEGTVAMSGSDPMVPRIAMMKALCGHQQKAARVENGSNSPIKNLLMHCGWSWAGATICPYIGKSWFHIVSKRSKS
jgi:hypothetical protein